MSPRMIVARSKAAGIDCIALTDHSCTENLPAFHTACAEAGMACLYGLEASTAEEVHMLCIFDDLSRAMDFGNMIYSHLPDRLNKPKLFGVQPVINENEEVLYFAKKLLSRYGYFFFDLIPMALNAGALCIPSHIDREMCGAISHLGFLPDLPYDAVEAVGQVDSEIARKWPVVRFSDAHHPDQIARRFTEVETDSFTVPALREAFQRLLLK